MLAAVIAGPVPATVKPAVDPPPAPEEPEPEPKPAEVIAMEPLSVPEAIEEPAPLVAGPEPEPPSPREIESAPAPVPADLSTRRLSSRRDDSFWSFGGSAATDVKSGGMDSDGFRW